MKTLLLFTCLLTLICSPVLAGKNAGGAMVVHTDNVDVNYTFFDPPDYCLEFEEYAPATCEELSHESTFVDPNFLLGAVIWYVAAFDPGAAPGVTVVYFGHDHNFGPGFIAGWGYCGPANTLEIPDGGWPDDTSAGNSIAFGSSIAGDHLFPFYWLGCYGDAGNFIGTTINPTGGYAAFVSDDNPGVLDEITRFGQVRWFEPGFNDCPSPEPMEACCFEDCTCLILTEEECVNGGGVWGFGDSCDPNPCPCPPPLGACCYEDCSCVVLTEEDCGGLLWLEDVLCDPNPCPCPQVACCFPDGSCIQTIDIECAELGGEIHGETCDPNPCPQPGACCFEDFSCAVLLEAECSAQGGVEWLEHVPCDPNPCPPIATEETTWGSIKSDYR